MDSLISLFKSYKSLPPHLSHQFSVTPEHGSVQPQSTSNSEQKIRINPNDVASLSVPSKSKIFRNYTLLLFFALFLSTQGSYEKGATFHKS